MKLSASLGRMVLALFYIFGPSAFAEIVTLREGTNLSLAISPDEQRMVVAIQSTLWVMPADGGAARQLTDPVLDAHAPAWSPNGETIAFSLYDSRGFGVGLLGVDGSGFRRLNTGPGDARDPTFDASGTHVVFASDNDANGYGLWKIELTTGALSRIKTGIEARYPIYARQGDHLSYVGYGEEPGIYVQSATGGSNRIVKVDRPFGPPTWNHAGTQLVYAEFDVQGLQARLNRVDLRSGKNTQLSDRQDVFPFRASALSDGGWIFAAGGKIWKHSPDGTEAAIPFAARIVLDKRDHNPIIDPPTALPKLVQG